MSIKGFLSLSPGRTRAWAKKIAEKVLQAGPGEQALVFGLSGDLGSGKTTFVQGFAQGLGIREKILSPTFVLFRVFQIPNPKTRTSPKTKIQNSKHSFRRFYHIDCYRIKEPKELLALGFKEIVADPENIVCLEWADRIKKILPKDSFWLRFEFKTKNQRKIISRV